MTSLHLQQRPAGWLHAATLKGGPRALRTPHRVPRPTRLACMAFKLDRRHHMNLAWERQLQQDALLSQLQPSNVAEAVQEVSSIAHLERILELSGGALCVIAFYSRSCGICRDVMADFKQLFADCRRQKARVVFLSANVMDEFDYRSDVARMYNVRSVPRFLFLVDGAVVRSVGMADTRQVMATRQHVRARLEEERRVLRQILWELLVKYTPSARR